MSNIKISALASASALDGTEEVPIVQSATTVKTTTQDIANLGGGSSYLVASITLTNDQIKALPTTPFKIIDGVPNKEIIFFSVFLSSSIVAIYTNYDASITLGIQDDDFDFLSSQLFAGDLNTLLNNTAKAQLSPLGYVNSSSTSLPLTSSTYRTDNGRDRFLFIDNGGAGNLTGGDSANTLQVTMYYAVVAL